MGSNTDDQLIRHLSEEMAEGYVMGKLSESEEQTVEEHLLVCASCLDRLEQTEEFVLVAREAMRREQEAVSQVPARGAWLSWKWLAPAFGAVALASGVFVFSGRTSTSPPTEVSLSSYRSAGSSAAPAGRSLTLSLQTDGLPASSYRYRIVTAAGSSVAEGDANAEAAKTTVQLKRPLAAGDYWVRLHSGDGTLIREYGLTVK